jgi:hypothetical protein
VRPNVPATLATSIFAPLRKRLKRCLSYHNFLSITVGRNNSDGEFIAVPVVGCTLAVDAEEERTTLGE